MPTFVKIRDVLEPIEIGSDFAETKNAFEVAAANGMRFMGVQKMNGKNIAFNMVNVQYFEESDDDVDFMGMGTFPGSDSINES
jgi:hypothetical protein